MIERCDDARAAMRSVLARTGDKWSVLIVVLLGDGARRFSEIKREVGGITQKVLTQTLRALERDGLIRRTPIPTMAPRVRYELTCLGRSLFKAVEPLGTWAQTHVADVSMARAEYDRRERARQGATAVAGRPEPQCAAGPDP